MKFRVFLKPIETTVETAIKTVKASVVLLNFLLAEMLSAGNPRAVADQGAQNVLWRQIDPAFEAMNGEQQEERNQGARSVRLNLQNWFMSHLPKKPKSEEIKNRRATLAGTAQVSTPQATTSRKSLPLFSHESVKLKDLFGSRNQRSSHGRRVKPSAKVAAHFGSEDEADLEPLDEEMSTSKNFHEQFSHDLLKKMAKADKEAEREEKAQRDLDEYKQKIMPGKKRTSGLSTEDQKPKKNLDQSSKSNKMTPKQRLAKKLKMRT
uniref:Uncharacterized protein n=1 Tax=Ditylenchus dipsaci TaxID=166011 RepID=A0A915DTE9_9BILA